MLGYGEYGNLTKQQADALIRKSYAGDLQAREKLIKHNLRYVIASARRYHHPLGRIQLEDLIQAGVMGLIHCVDSKKYDPERGTTFLSYARHQINASISRYLLTFHGEFNSQSSKGGRYLFWHINSVKLINNTTDPDRRKELYDQLRSRFPTLSDGEFELGFAIHSRSFISKDDLEDQALHGDAPRAAMRVYYAYNAHTCAQSSSEELLIQEDFSAKLKVVVDKIKHLLTEREWEVINRYILAEEDETMDSIGKSLGVTRERVRQIKEKALSKIRKVYGQELLELSA